MVLVVYTKATETKPTKVNLYSSMLLFKYKKNTTTMMRIWYTIPHHEKRGNLDWLEAAAPARATIHDMTPYEMVVIANGSLVKLDKDIGIL